VDRRKGTGVPFREHYAIWILPRSNIVDLAITFVDRDRRAGTVGITWELFSEKRDLSDRPTTGLNVRCASHRGLRAEAVSLRTGCADGVVCKVMLLCADESRAVAEKIGKLLRLMCKAVLCSHRAGYCVRYLVEGPSRPRRTYVARALVNT
jgi:hypothetical protein